MRRRKRLVVEDPNYYFPRKIKKRKAEEEAKFDSDKFGRDERHAKTEKKMLNVLVEEIATKKDLNTKYRV